MKRKSGELQISQARFTSASTVNAATGLLGWISLVINDTLRLDGLALRHTADGRLTLSFPARRDSSDREHAFVCPLDDRARREIEHQVFRALGFEESTPR